jgi:hypothetical protein
MPGWNHLVVGWSLGAVGTGSAIEIDEPLEGAKLGIFLASNHVILSGVCPKSTAESLPEIGIRSDNPLKVRSIWARSLDLITGRRAKNEQNEWRIVDPMSYARHEGELYVRFDQRPLRIGSHVIEMERASDLE